MALAVQKGVRLLIPSQIKLQQGLHTLRSGSGTLQRDTKQLSAIYEKYGFLVKRICRNVLRQDHDAEDAMHETFLKFWRYTENMQLEEPREIVAVLKRTALSCAIDHLRSRNRQGKYRDAWRDLKEVTHVESVENRVEQRMNQQIVAILFRAVRTDQTTLEMAYLYYMDEMTLEEVAKATGFSRRSVGMKLERFRENALKYCRNHNIQWGE